MAIKWRTPGKFTGWRLTWHDASGSVCDYERETQARAEACARKLLRESGIPTGAKVERFRKGKRVQTYSLRVSLQPCIAVLKPLLDAGDGGFYEIA